MTYADIWSISALGDAADFGSDPDQLLLEPPAGSLVWRQFVLPPGHRLADLDEQAAREEFETRLPGIIHTGEIDPSRPGFHRTDTVDLVTVVAGEVWLILDDGEVLLEQGDTVVQRGTWHAWSNRSDDDCRLSTVTISRSRRYSQGTPGA